MVTIKMEGNSEMATNKKQTNKKELIKEEEEITKELNLDEVNDSKWDPKEALKVLSEQVGRIAHCSTVNIREKPGKESKVLHVFPVNKIVTVDGMDASNEWAHVVSREDKRAGWVMVDFLEEV